MTPASESRTARSTLRALALALGCALAWASTATAQIPSHLVRRRVVAVRVTGETSGATGARDVGIPLGAPLTRRLLRSTVQRLIESGRWADVQIDAVAEGSDVALVVYLRPRIVITRVDVNGNEVLDDDEVRQTLGLGASGELEQQDLEPLADAVAEAYDQRGYLDARVTLRLRDTDDPTRKVLRVRIDEDEPTRIARLAFEGGRPPSDVDVPDALGLDQGDVLDRTRLRDGLREARRLLRREGFFESRLEEPRVERVGPRAARLVLPLRLGPRYRLRLTGHEPLERTTVEAVLELEDERLTRRSLEALDERVTQLLQRHGFHDADVEVHRWAGAREGTAILEVRMRPGEQLHVVGMSFPGATHFDSDYLRGQVLSVVEAELPDTRMFAPVDTDTVDRLGLGGRSVSSRRRVPRPLEVDPTRVYYEPLYEQAVEHLREVYEAAGYLSARVGPPRLRVLRQGEGRAVVMIPVFEGPRTLLFDVDLRGNELLGSRALLEAAELRRGEPFSYLALEEALARMTELYHERGHLYARIEPQVRFSENRERAEVVLEVVERFEVRFGAITVEGASRTDEGLIRDALRFEEGDLYRPSVVRASQDALMALGVFTSVNITPQNPDLAERIKPITVTVRERLPQYLDYQLGISTGQGLRTSLEYGYRNLFGYALNVTLRAQLGLQFFFQDEDLRRNISNLPLEQRLERRPTISLGLPHVAGLDDVRASLDVLLFSRDNQRAFGLDKTGVVLSFNWRPLQRLSFTWSGEIEQNNVQLFGDRETFEQILEDERGNPQIARLLRVPEGNSVVVSTRLSGALDQRDSPFVPTEGWFTSASVEWVRTLETDTPDDTDPFFSHFLKLTVTLNGYLSIGDVVLAGQVRTGGIVHLQDGSRTYPNRQFFLGGVDSLRGFNQAQLQTQDVAEFQLQDPDERTTPFGTLLQGGDFFYLVRAELRFPLFASLQGALFGDFGNHWADPNQITAACADGLSTEQCLFVRPTAGAGVRLATPVGPLALDVGFNLLRREELNEPLVAFHFSIGVF
ncbi:MAG TPA: POTRA domain-containing protein [Sandaracinaceae bacterium LLY-WYZ-13_1]|nr:POTRA domain-containing protein [Sandaracinaceae bacterium LLY-WYZ-13_1]